MTIDNGITLLISLIALLLFVSERLRADLVAMLVLLSLIITGLLTADEAFQGFASPAVITVWAVFIISGGLQRSGVADIVARRLLSLAGDNPRRLLILLMLTAGLMSAFMNNIGAVAILMPAVISIGRKLDIPVSKLLIPLAFAALLGGNITLVGTPPNILAVSIMQERGIEAFRFFDFAPTGLVVLTVGILYMMVVGQRLLPDRATPGGLANEYPVRSYLSELLILPGSPLIGKTVIEAAVNDRFGINVVYIERNEDEILSPEGSALLELHDRLLVEGTPAALLQIQHEMTLRPVADYSVDSWHPPEDVDKLHLGEVTLAPNSRLADLTLGQLDFRGRFGLSVLAIRHHGASTASNLRDRAIGFGDSLLVQGPIQTFDKLLNDPNLLVLERPNIQLRRTSKAPVAMITLLAVVVAASLGLLPVAAIMLAGALFIILAGVLTIEEAYRAIDWQAVFLIAGMLPLGTAMEKSGTARLLADQLVAIAGNGNNLVILAALFIVTALLTEVISNAAATVLLVPIALDMALHLHVNPQPLVLTTVIAASTSFLMPIGHQVNMIIFGAGGYRFTDYTRVGIWLNLLILVTTLIMVPLLWPLTG